ncbi:MAG: ligase-associated DNA damage response endonuclease PdeM [Parvularculaceae bacterium]
MKAETSEFCVNGERLVALLSGALFWPAKNTLIVSDLHFEKGSNFGARGVLLPPYDTRTTIRRLAVIMAEIKPERVISLGDAFHDRGAEARMDEDDADALAIMTGAAEWVWILGNHDPEPPVRFAGAVAEEMQSGALLFRHEPQPVPQPGEIAGHLHPVARVKAETRLIRRRCFATDGERLVMPAFGAYSGGLNVLDDAFAPIFTRVTCHVLGGTGVYPFTGAALVADPPNAVRIDRAAG